MDVEPGQGAIGGGYTATLHVVAEVVTSLLAEGTQSTGHTRLNRNTITWKKKKSVVNTPGGQFSSIIII